MAGAIPRLGAGLITLGLSEAGQKKPFQNLGAKDEPIGPLSASPLRFVPIAGTAGSTADVGINALIPKAPDIPAPPPTLKASDTPVQQAVAEAARRRSRARGYRSTILSQMMPQQSGGTRETFGG